MNADATTAKILQRLIDRAEAEIAEAEKTIQAKGVLLAELKRELVAFKVPADMVVRPRKERSLADAIADVLRADSRPMRPAEVAVKLKEFGAKTASKRGLLPMVASVLNKRKHRFEQVARGLYKLKEAT
jgi:hypothetical protein